MTDDIQANTTTQDELLSGFDLEALRLRQDYSETPVEKVIITIPVRKPGPMDFVRVHRDLRFETTILDLKDEGEKYIIPPAFHGEVPQLIHPVSLRLTTNRQGVLTMWPLRLPGADGRVNPWHQSALDAAVRAEMSWVSVRSNRSLGAYEVFQGAKALPEPEWPNMGIGEIVEIAFRNFIINSAEHPVLRRLRGEV